MLHLYNNHNYVREPTILVSIYGADQLAQLMGKLYKYVPTSEELDKFPFKYRNIVKNTLNRGRLPHHCIKRNGRIAKKYHNLRESLREDFQKIPVNYDIRIKFEYCLKKIQNHWRSNILTKYTNCAIMIQKYLRGYLTRDKLRNAMCYIQSNIDINTDIITTEQLIQPAYIVSDWNRGSKIFLNLSTIYKLRKFDQVPAYTHVNVEGIEEVFYVEQITRFFVSPFTRSEFTVHDVGTIDIKIIELARRMTKNKRHNTICVG